MEKDSGDAFLRITEDKVKFNVEKEPRYDDDRRLTTDDPMA